MTPHGNGQNEVCVEWDACSVDCLESALIAIPRMPAPRLDHLTAVTALNLANQVRPLTMVWLSLVMVAAVADHGEHRERLSLVQGITGVRSLGRFPFLQSLNLSFNKLEQLPCLAGCIRLQAINASHNRLATLLWDSYDAFSREIGGVELWQLIHARDSRFSCVWSP